MENQSRSVDEVFRDHLERRSYHDLEEDIARNYAENVTLLTTYGVFHGHEGVRRSAKLLRRLIPAQTYEYRTRLTDGEVAFLEWTARTQDEQVCDGADSYLIRDGKIVVQTIHYTVHTRGDERSGR